jgi:hypothetical protein
VTGREHGQEPEQIRPLRRVNEGCWRSRDGRWTFMRHWSDPQPGRWFAFFGDRREPANEGEGHTRLQDVADWAEALGEEVPGG